MKLHFYLILKNNQNSYFWRSLKSIRKRIIRRIRIYWSTERIKKQSWIKIILKNNILKIDSIKNEYSKKESYYINLEKEN